MTYSKTILCLANSRKTNGRCIAGREWGAKAPGAWVRPVSARQTREVADHERRLAGGGNADLGDIVTVTFQQAAPHPYQPENHLIDTGTRWSRLRRASWADVVAAVDDVTGPLWANGFSSYAGHNDRLPDGLAANFGRSLYLVKPDDLCLQIVTDTYDGQPRRKCRASFQLAGSAYDLSLTDPLVEQVLRDKADGRYAMADALACISLGEPFHGYAYKLVASLIVPGRIGGAQ